ncbi:MULTISPECIES: AraC family transcriptional regulator [Dickeya]|uniref:Transcriptional activator of yqhD and dkgA aldehyde sensor n=1 Tax=Dickeya aquatica TaxID=1401087 RepID=A0A375A647_9GAMM|nr:MULTISPECIES: AraC family transcriptional regulator [Dickeya]SLM61534.1 Transcriptional activator of yqhD and dkgA; aldehyde sensor [Dickeya aquatica]
MQNLTTRQRLINLAMPFASPNCISQTPIPQVKVIYTDRHGARTPVLYDPCIVIIFQGHKVGYLGGKRFHYDPENYLLMTVPLPFECESFASRENPIVGISIRVDIPILQDLLIEMGDDGYGEKRRADTTSINSVPLNDAVLCAAERLLEAMANARDARVLGPWIVREILYHVLCGPCGDSLQALMNRYSHFSQIARALRHIENHYADSLSVEALAMDVNMSVSAFHHNFKAVTNTSPLQYLKSYRLHKARLLMLQDGLKANTASMQVGYESPSQFSREFKRFFGATPGDEVARLRSGQAVMERNAW